MFYHAKVDDEDDGIMGLNLLDKVADHAYWCHYPGLRTAALVLLVQ